MFIRNETFYSFTRNYPVVTILISIHLVLFLLVTLGRFGIFFPGLLIESLFVGWNQGIAEGDWWRLITPILLHADISHVLFNSFALFLFGPALEQMLGKSKFITFYFLTGVIANIATFILNDPEYRHVGASGAIYGLLGMYLYMIYFKQHLIDPMSRQIVKIILVIGLIMTFLMPNINTLAHLIGALSGAAIAPLFLTKARPYIPYVRTPPPRGDSSPNFNPTRWKRRGPRMNGSLVANILGILFIILVVAGIVSNFF
ncbi:membrane associated rhomboid family serine protease [Geomicrobium halophilum]|uniref:Membrane associated rhomboid family serine protease n=1 Tax=Geomicrobium halophilum TaxID=549000 RepID=A0A841PVN7_9BACL|nr:rhomboid family intramembrane serine protease [Geomicrobium halophilum]MBB6451266.1 membrane associated rhomboid family serine protease [Geomicrobium halophilum]